LQKSLNLALGSSLATIGLTIPAVAAVAVALHKDLVLAWNERNTVARLTMIASVLTFGTGAPMYSRADPHGHFCRVRLSDVRALSTDALR